MAQFLVGSKYLCDNYDFYRKSKDIDYIVDVLDDSLPKCDEHGTRIEYHLNPVLFKFFEQEGCDRKTEALFTLKLSHMFWDIKWSKHLDDIKWFIDNKFEYIPSLYKDLVEQWKIVHGPRNEPDFSKPNSEFFYDKVKRDIGHDELHNIVKFYDVPLFEKIKKDLDQAQVYENLFYKLSHNDRIKLVTEEMLVIGLERYTEQEISHNSKLVCFKVLKILVLRLLPEWLALWTMLNFREILNNSKLIKTIKYTT